MKNRIAPFALVAAVALAACGDAALDARDAQPSAAVAPPKPTVTTLDGDSIGKPSLPVAISYRFLDQPAVGEPARIELSVAGADLSGLSLTLRGRDGLTLAKQSPAVVAMKAAAEAGAPQRHEAIVVAAQEGRTYLNVQVSGIHENQPFVKAISIPVQIGEGGPQLQRNGEIVDTGLEVLSSMPAEQQIEPVAEPEVRD